MGSLTQYNFLGGDIEWLHSASGCKDWFDCTHCDLKKYIDYFTERYQWKEHTQTNTHTHTHTHMHIHTHLTWPQKWIVPTLVFNKENYHGSTWFLFKQYSIFFLFFSSYHDSESQISLVGDFNMIVYAIYSCDTKSSQALK